MLTKELKIILLRHSKKRKLNTNSKYNIYKKFNSNPKIFLGNIFFPFYNDYESLSDIDKIKLKNLPRISRRYFL